MGAYTWTMCCLRLRQRYRCIALDLRGHGDSDWSENYTIPAHVGDVLAVLEQLDWRATNLVGMSLGGVVAAHTTTAMGTTSIDSLSLIDVAPGVSFASVDRIRDFMSSGSLKGGPKALAEHATRLGASQSMTELKYRYTSLSKQLPNGEWVWKHDTRLPTDYQHILAHIEEISELATDWRIRCQIVRGERSRILSAHAAKAFAGKCNQGEMASVSCAGHSVQEDNPVELAEVLSLFWGNS